MNEELIIMTVLLSKRVGTIQLSSYSITHHASD